LPQPSLPVINPLVNAVQFAVVTVRIFGFVIVVLGLFQLLSSLAATFGKIGLVYWQTFLLTVVLPPVIWLAGGLLIVLLARPIGRLLSCGLGEKKPDAS